MTLYIYCSFNEDFKLKNRHALPVIYWYRHFRRHAITTVLERIQQKWFPMLFRRQKSTVRLPGRALWSQQHRCSSSTSVRWTTCIFSKKISRSSPSTSSSSSEWLYGITGSSVSKLPLLGFVMTQGQATSVSRTLNRWGSWQDPPFLSSVGDGQQVMYRRISPVFDIPKFFIWPPS